MVIRYNCSQFQSWDGDRAKRTVWRSAFSQFTSHMAAWDGILPCRLSEQTFQLLSVLFKEPTVSDAWLCGAVLCAENPRVHKEHVALMPCLSPFGLRVGFQLQAASFYHSISIYWGTVSSSNLSKVTHEWLTRIHTPELSWFLNPLLWALYHTIFQVSVLTSCKFILQHDSLKWKWTIFSDSSSTSEEALHPEYRFHFWEGDKKRS